MRSISVKVSAELGERLMATANRRRTTVSEVIRDALEAFTVTNVKKGQPLFIDLAGDLVGCLSGGPTDLSSNPKHMEGYGKSARDIK